MSYTATINTPGYLPEAEPAEFDTAAEAWWYLYHERCEEERDWINETGLCDNCGEPYTDDHDDDSETGRELGRLARCDQPGVLIAPSVAPKMHDLGVAYAVTVTE